MAGFYVPQAELFAEWQMLWRERLHELALTQMDGLVERAVQRPEKWRMGLELTQRLLELEPWRESAHRQRMLLLAYTGQRKRPLPSMRYAARHWPPNLVSSQPARPKHCMPKLWPGSWPSSTACRARRTAPPTTCRAHSPHSLAGRRS
ncbi:MAG: hypothetical protein IPM57_12590 [Oligoflexia bacterium]|nr:hypothetical protein [Oligoflexia bacterium]